MVAIEKLNNSFNPLVCASAAIDALYTRLLQLCDVVSAADITIAGPEDECMFGECL